MKTKLLSLALAALLLVGLAACAGENGSVEPLETEMPTGETVSPGPNEETRPEKEVTVFLSGSGTQEDPWLVGSPEESGVRIYTAETALIAEGEGEMMDFREGDVLPWTAILPEMECFFWDSGITSVGAYSFCGMGREEMGVSVYFPEELRTIGAGAFENTYFDYNLTIPESVETVESRAFAGASMGDCELEGNPHIAENAFVGAEVTVKGRSAMGWTAEAPAFCKDGVTWEIQHTFSYEVDYGTEEMGMSGAIYLSEDDEYQVDAVLDFAQDGYHFVHYELVEGDLPMEDPTCALLKLHLTGDVRVRVYCEAD